MDFNYRYIPPTRRRRPDSVPGIFVLLCFVMVLGLVTAGTLALIVAFHMPATLSAPTPAIPVPDDSPDDGRTTDDDTPAEDGSIPPQFEPDSMPPVTESAHP